MPLDPSIPLQVKPPDPAGSLSGILDVAKGAAEVKTARAQAQSAQQSATQRAALAKFDFQQLMGADGTVDLNKVGDSGLREAAGDQFPEVLSHLIGVRNEQLTSKQKLLDLTNDQRKTFGDMMGALRSDPDVQQDTAEGRRKVAETFGQFAQLYGNDANGVLGAYAGSILKVPPGKLGQTIQNVQLQATSASEQATRQAPQYGYTNTGSELQRTQTNAYAPGGVQAPERLQLGISPGEQSTVVTDQLGNQFEMRRDARGNIVSTRPLGQPQGGGQPSGPASFGPGERASIESQAQANFENVSANRKAASLAPQQLDQIRKARELSQSVSTGKWAVERAGIESGLSSLIPGLSAASDDATKLQKLDKFLERISSDSSKVLGTTASTDAARESISRQNASLGYTPKAIQGVLEYAEAQTLAMAAKGDAQEAWLAKGNKITQQHDFETAWRKAYDPVVFQLQVADAAEKKRIIDKLSPAEAAELKNKRARLRELGAIP